MRLKQIAMLLLVVAISACTTDSKESGKGGKEDIFADVKVKPANNEVGGELTDYLEIISGDYSVRKSNGVAKLLEIKVKLKAKAPLKEIPDAYIRVELNILDKEEMPISGFDGFRLGVEDWEPLKGLLKRGNGELIGTFYMDSKLENPTKEEMKEAISKAKLFTINSTFVEKSKSSDSDDEDSEEDEDYDDEDETASEDWDDLMEEYEEYMEDYLRLMKKAQSGDTDAIEEYQEMLEDAQDIARKLEALKGNVSPSQVREFVSLQNKFVRKAAELQEK